jgi:DNA-binding CsgD family transcriptional regulator
MRADTRAALKVGTQSLTPRERAVAALVTQGLRNREIAVVLGLKLPTIKQHMAHIFAKLHLTNRVMLALYKPGATPMFDPKPAKLLDEGLAGLVLEAERNGATLVEIARRLRAKADALAPEDDLDEDEEEDAD